VIRTEFRIGENAPQVIKDLCVAGTVTGVTLEYFAPILTLLVDELTNPEANTKVLIDRLLML
jgi:hypothetical protein